ncbi:MAG: DUF1003 domain-containing protein [Candidatus Diapherotrites archaeon]
MNQKPKESQKPKADEKHHYVDLEHLHRHKRTLGQKAADAIAEFGGSWIFISLFFLFLIVWISINFFYLTNENAFDPFPFILLNLALSCLAAIQAPIILMSQNRQAFRDRAKAERDYYVNRKAEREIENIQTDLDEIKKILKNTK